MTRLYLNNHFGQGRLLQGRGEWNLAIEHYNRVLTHLDSPIDKALVETELSWCYTMMGRYDQALDRFKELYGQVQQMAKDPSLSGCERTEVGQMIVRVLHGLTEVTCRLGLLEQGFRWSQQALEQSLALDDPYLVAVSKYYVAIPHYNAGDVDQVLILLDEALDVIRATEHPRMLARTLNLKGIVSRMKGRLDEAEEAYNEALQIHENLGEYERIATILNNLSLIHRHRGSYTTSLRLLKKAEVLAEEVQSWILLYHILDNLSKLHLTLGAFDAARSSAQRLVQLARENHLQRQIGFALGALANVEQHWNTANARALFEEAMVLLEGLEVGAGAKELLLVIVDYIEFLLRVEDFDLAEEYIARYEAFARERSITMHEAEFAILRGLLERGRDNLGLAQHHLRRAAQLSQKDGYYLIRVKSSLCLAENALERFQLRGKTNSFLEAAGHVEEGLNLAKDGNLFPSLAAIQLIQALLHQAEGRLEDAVSLLDENLHLCEEKGLRLQEARTRVLKGEVEGALKQQRDQQKIPSITDYDPTSAILGTIRLFFHEDYSQIAPDPDQTAVVVFYLSPMGPVPKLEDLSQSHLLGKEPKHAVEEILTLMGSFLTMAIGQGHDYCSGLFGPLPVPRLPGTNAVVYSTFTSDYDNDLQEDPRFGEGSKCQNYALACLIYPREYDTVFFDRQYLGQRFEELIQALPDMKPHGLKRWKQQFLHSVQDQFLAAMNNPEPTL